MRSHLIVGWFHLKLCTEKEGYCFGRMREWIDWPTFGSLFIDLLYIGMPVVRTNGWTYGHVITKISRMGGLPHFPRYGATLERGWPSRGAPLRMSLLNLSVVILFCRTWAGFSVVLGSTGCRVRAGGAYFGGDPAVCSHWKFLKLDSLKHNFLRSVDRNWLSGKVFKELKNTLRNEISDLTIMIIGLQLFVLLVDSKTNSNRKEWTNPDDRWFIDSNFNVQFSCCMIDSSEIVS